MEEESSKNPKLGRAGRGSPSLAFGQDAATASGFKFSSVEYQPGLFKGPETRLSERLTAWP